MGKNKKKKKKKEKKVPTTSEHENVRFSKKEKGLNGRGMGTRIDTIGHLVKILSTDRCQSIQYIHHDTT